MPKQSIWQHINVSLPVLKYENLNTSGQGKGSTTGAAHSHSPVELELWNDFEALVALEGQKTRNQTELDVDFVGQLNNSAKFSPAASSEQEVTNFLQLSLNCFSYDEWGLSGGINFKPASNQITANPDLIAIKHDPVGLGEGGCEEYIELEPQERAKVRRENTQHINSLYRMPVAVKPVWEFGFIKTASDVINEWEIPEDFNQAEESLPESWTSEKKKVFHLVRQMYGQMMSGKSAKSTSEVWPLVSVMSIFWLMNYMLSYTLMHAHADNCRYGILTTYERWFFWTRTETGTLKVSRSFEREATNPSVFQAVKTIIGFNDHVLDSEETQIHQQSANAPPKKKHRGANSSRKTPPNGGTNPEWNLAASLYPWDCKVCDATDSILLLTTTKDPTVIVKIQNDPRNKHVAEEMAHEAAIYAALQKNQAACQVIPRFRGHSTHLGVAMTCIEKELDDFEDIGLENLTESLRKSAIQSIEVLSKAGILHNDIELRNIVQSRTDPRCAKVIDFGRASFSGDQEKLAKQVNQMKILLNHTENSTS